MYAAAARRSRNNVHIPASVPAPQRPKGPSYASAVPKADKADKKRDKMLPDIHAYRQKYAQMMMPEDERSKDPELDQLKQAAKAREDRMRARDQRMRGRWSQEAAPPTRLLPQTGDGEKPEWGRVPVPADLQPGADMRGGTTGADTRGGTPGPVEAEDQQEEERRVRYETYKRELEKERAAAREAERRAARERDNVQQLRLQRIDDERRASMQQQEREKLEREEAARELEELRRLQNRYAEQVAKSPLGKTQPPRPFQQPPELPPPEARALDPNAPFANIRRVYQAVDAVPADHKWRGGMQLLYCTALLGRGPPEEDPPTAAPASPLPPSSPAASAAPHQPRPPPAPKPVPRDAGPASAPHGLRLLWEFTGGQGLTGIQSLQAVYPALAGVTAYSGLNALLDVSRDGLPGLYHGLSVLHISADVAASPTAPRSSRRSSAGPAPATPVPGAGRGACAPHPTPPPRPGPAPPPSGVSGPVGPADAQSPARKCEGLLALGAASPGAAGRGLGALCALAQRPPPPPAPARAPVLASPTPPPHPRPTPGWVLAARPPTCPTPSHWASTMPPTPPYLSPSSLGSSRLPTPLPLPGVPSAAVSRAPTPARTPALRGLDTLLSTAAEGRANLSPALVFVTYAALGLDARGPTPTGLQHVCAAGHEEGKPYEALAALTHAHATESVYSSVVSALTTPEPFSSFSPAPGGLNTLLNAAQAESANPRAGLALLADSHGQI